MDTRTAASRTGLVLRIAGAAAAALALNALIALPASATSFCNIKRTSDGFGALRAGPDANARLLARMRPGDEVMLGMNERGPWQQVTFWRGQTRHQDGGFARGQSGWVHRSLLGECG